MAGEYGHYGRQPSQIPLRYSLATGPEENSQDGRKERTDHKAVEPFVFGIQHQLHKSEGSDDRCELVDHSAFIDN
jgi:hypothetical protein